jgi:hypothetical protein
MVTPWLIVVVESISQVLALESKPKPDWLLVESCVATARSEVGTENIATKRKMPITSKIGFIFGAPFQIASEAKAFCHYG